MAIIEGTVTVKSYHSGTLQGDGGMTYKFNRKAIVQGAFDEINRGQRLRFRPDGARARDVEVLAEVVEAVEKPKTTPRPRRSGPYRFLNPYNFVRTLEVADPAAEPLLGRCPPPPHDRYVGLSGRITCELTVATPLFISDSEGVELDKDVRDHFHYRFFRDPDGNIAIPGTSLRGPIRSIFEAATNSCFIHFSGHKRLSYHLPPSDALRLVPGRVRKTSAGEWKLDLLPGTTPVNPDRRPSGPQYAAWIPTYRPLWNSKTKAKSPHSPYSQRRSLSLQNWRHVEPCRALVEQIQHPLRQFEFWNVVALAKPGQSLPSPGPGQQGVDGYISITNQNIENKHDERIFFRATGNASASQPLPLSASVRKQYKELVEDYQERHADAVRKRKQHKQPVDAPVGREPAFSRFIMDKSAAKLSDGDLVYAMLDRRGMSFKVGFIVPVSVPRVGYENTIGDLLYPDDLDACDKYLELCPACRTFGWVDPEPEKDEERVAYAGRVRISHAQRLAGGTLEPFDATLAILSTPKPTTSRFYLKPKTGKPQNSLPDDKVNYDAYGQKLRGRKFYRHQGEQLNRQEYESVGHKKSDQNRTVHDIQPPGTEFSFNVDFENLASAELGALLWSLEMEGWHHRLGYGKPLGFGSAAIQVTELQKLDASTRYEDFEPDAGLLDSLEAKDTWVETFKQAMAERYGNDFQRLDNVRDLKALLAKSPSLPVHYPRSSKKPHPDGRNFEWFVGNKRSGRNAGPRLGLRLADEDTVGLPLLNKRGEEV